ncbi:signal peptidase I [Halorubrum sp. SP3]|uniref:signal peptidase I n=1 Tax=unclassified Halorubrum TaxID=2642239 RepID=UPI0010F77BD9|nr:MULTISPECIES: signal peptidase I [unclassified Halorubrum]TKX53832.1 signal peptidase I [Halorubrum sp. SP3]TKX70417.1 signal peptidase I [Halorubrum sp. SP9]
MTQLLTSPRTKRAANVLGIVLLIALVAPFAVYAAPEVVGADESFVVLTASMTPAIAPGDVVIIAERDPAAIAEGDVITFVRGTSDVPVTHRVIDVVDEASALAFETMGDANEGPDPGLVPAGNLVGVVTLTIPYIGYVIQFAGTRVGFVALVLLPFGLLAVTEVWSIVRGRDESKSPATATDDPDRGDAETAQFEFATESELAPATDAAGASGGVSVDAVGGAAAVLVVFAPYAVYVAFELRSAVAIAAAVATATLLCGALAMWVPASGVLDRSGQSAAAEPERDASETAVAGEVSESERDGDETDSAAVATDEERVEPDESAPVQTPTARPDAAGEGD